MAAPGLYVYEPQDGYDEYYYIDKAQNVFHVTPSSHCVLTPRKPQSIVEHCRYVVYTHLILWFDYFMQDMQREVAERKL